MILQALYDYYQRKAADSEHSGEKLAPSGWEMKAFPFILVLDTEGRLVAIDDRRPAEKGKTAKSWMVPQGVKKTSGVAANLLWDNTEYVLCYVPEGKKPDRIAEQHKAFITKIQESFPDYEQDAGIKAVLLFLQDNPLAEAMKNNLWPDIIKTTGANLTFKISGKTDLICQSEYVQNAVNQSAGNAGNDADGYCLITGNKAKIARTHPAIKGVLGAQTAGGNIVSFNQSAFISYGKEQGKNAPVSEEAANYYTTALNHLLNKNSGQRTYIGDTTTLVWWAERETPLETGFGLMFGAAGRDNPDARTEAINSLISGVWKGTNYKDSENTKFYILGLAPNAARIAIRFFKVATVEEFAGNIRNYFKEISLPYFIEKNYFPPLPKLCAALASGEDLDRLPPNFQGAIFEAIISNTPYPKLFFFSALRRIRAGQNITTNLAAIIKACLIRNFEKEVSMTLDVTNRETGYLLGRLFAVYDKLKEDETENRSNRRDKFMSAFMTRPQSVFQQLYKLSNIDLKKLSRSKETRGWAANYDRKIKEILNLMYKDEKRELIDFLPPLLDNPQQALFAMVYYHQKQDFFIKKTTQEEESSNAA